MNKMNSLEIQQIDDLVFQLDNPDGLKRAQARLELVQVGQPGVPALIVALSNPEEHIRWEAAKALQEIRDPHAAKALVKALSDQCLDVRWAAAEALYPLEDRAIIPLLEDLLLYYESTSFRALAHYILRNLANKNPLKDPVLKVFNALDDVQPELIVPWTVEAALKELKSKEPDRRGVI